MKIKVTTKNVIPNALCRMKDDGNYETVINVSLKNLPKLLRKYEVQQWKIIIHNKVTVFFHWFGAQNDYLFPPKDEENTEQYPFRKPHLWKTRFGFKTAWELAKILG